MPRALLVSDVRLYREALAWRLAQSGRVDVIGTVGSAAKAELAKTHGADYVIDSVADLWPVLETIAARIDAGEQPGA